MDTPTATLLPWFFITESKRLHSFLNRFFFSIEDNGVPEDDK